MRRIALAVIGFLTVCRTLGFAQTADSLPAGWIRPDTLLSSLYSVGIDRETRRSGLGSLRIRRDQRETTSDIETIAQVVLADAFRGKRVRLSGYLRVSDSTGTAGLLLAVSGSPTGTPYDNTLFWRPLRGSVDWQRRDVVLNVPADAQHIRIGVLFRGSGAAWFDDLDFSVVDTAVATTGRLLPAWPPPALQYTPGATPGNLDLEPRQLAPLRLAAFTRTDTRIPMRDGRRLFTIIAVPRAAAKPLPIMLERTPYGARPVFYRGLAGYIFVAQDIRGRVRSEGQYIMNRRTRAAGDTTAVDETTDAWDTVDWLIRNVPNNNGRVGVIGVSYPGWLAETVLLDPHPAVKAVSPQAPMSDTWMGDDFFHQGAFRLDYGFTYAFGMEGESAGIGPFPTQGKDLYEWYLSYPTLAAFGDSTRVNRTPSWQRFAQHPAYDSEWQGRAFQRLVKGVKAATLTVGGFWDQEDLFGPQATYTAMERFDTAGRNSLVLGPWFHGQWASSGGSTLGNLRFASATADTFLIRMQAPWFAYWLKGEGDGRFPEARVFDAGTNEWRSFAQWPPTEAVTRKLYLHAGGRLSFEPPSQRTGFDEYISDPAQPVPYVPRPVTYDTWARWMTDDQRFASERADVRTWQTEPLPDDVVLAGNIVARLFASTSGSDADWVVKLIDVYPDNGEGRAEMANYQLMVAGDIMRGRYFRSFEQPTPLTPNQVQSFDVDLHQQFYTFRRGHRIMVQVQSSWFPVYDRNPQTFVPNIFEASAAAYRAQTHRIYRTTAHPSQVSVMVLPSR